MDVYRATFPRADLPIARRISDQVLCIPIYGHLSPSAQARVIAAIRGAAQ